MGIKSRIASPAKKDSKEMLAEKLYREERNYRADRLVEKWSHVAEVGKGITKMSTTTARNLAILLENQARVIHHMDESLFSSAFYGYTPENMLRLIRLSYPNSIRGQLFTEFAMETVHDSIKYIQPIYTNAQRNDFDWDLNQPQYTMDNRFDDPENNHDVMYESTESRYATELVNADNVKVESNTVTVEYKGGAFGENGENYIDGFGTLYIIDNKGKRQAAAMQAEDGTWFGGKKILVDSDAGTVVGVSSIASEDKKVIFTLSGAVTKAAAIGRYDSEKDLTGKYLGEVELVMRDYHFRPRPISLGVTWTHLTELALDTSFGVSAEEMLMDSAAQEIKKTLDFQSVKFASDAQKTRASENFVVFDAESPVYDSTEGSTTKDSYFHTAQLIGQAIARIGDLQLNKINRGGVSAIVGGPAACNYLSLNKAWSDKGKQPAIGGHKVGEIDGIPVFKVPSSIIADDELLTTWKNPTVESDVSLAIGTLMAFYSTGIQQRKNFYKEAGVARYEDSQVLNPNYFGRIKVKNIREVVGANA